MDKLLAFAFCLSGFSAAAQHSHPAAERPVVLLPGIGRWHHPIATRNPEAQKFFDQGIVLTYGFNRPEALRSFRKALDLDPSAAMAWWGISFATGPYINMDMDPDVRLKDACSAAQSGLRVSGVSAADRAWLEAAAARCPEFADPSKYVAAMRALAARFPDDADAQTLFAESLLLPVRWRWYTSEGKPAAGVEEAERVLLNVIHRWPDHPGANHLYIHAVESSPTPELGVPSALRLMGTAPAAGHVVHMPSHIWLALGDYASAIDINERAARADREYFARTGAMSSYYEYYLHNLQFIVYARSMQGNAAGTRRAAAEMTDAAKMMPEMADVFMVLASLARVRVADWDTLLAAPRPSGPLGEAFWHYCRAMAFAARADLNNARAEQKQFEQLAGKLDRNMAWDTNRFGDVLDLAAAELDARLEPSRPAAIARWRKAVAMQDRLAYDEPPAWYYPLRESLGVSLLLNGDAGGAEAVFREGLRRSPHNGRMLFGLRESLKAQRKTDAAAWVDGEFQAAWKNADMRIAIRTPGRAAPAAQLPSWQ